MQEKKCIIENQIVSYLESTSTDRKNTLLFLHGWMQDKGSFSHILKILEEKNISYISLDLPGFWGTSLKNANMHIEDYGNFIVHFIEKIGLQQAVLVGHSFGGRISIYLWSFYNNISKIVLIGAAGISPKDNIGRLLIVKTWKIVFSLPWLKSIWKKIKSQISAPDYISAGKMTKIYRNTIKNDLRKYMKNMSLPTLMIWWDSDDQVPLQEAKIMHENIWNSQLEILTGTHFIHQEEPKKVTNFILDFIRN